MHLVFVGLFLMFLGSQISIAAADDSKKDKMENKIVQNQTSKSKSVGSKIKTEQENSEKCEDSHLVYKTCTHQKTIFTQGLEKAKKSNRLLLLIYGFEECPWCHNLHQLFSKGDLKSFANQNFVVVDINIKEPSGKEVFLSNRSDYKKTPAETGFPFLVIINPKTGGQTYLETTDLEDNTNGKDHDISKLKSALLEKVKPLK